MLIRPNDVDLTETCDRHDPGALCPLDTPITGSDCNCIKQKGKKEKSKEKKRVKGEEDKKDTKYKKKEKNKRIREKVTLRVFSQLFPNPTLKLSRASSWHLM